MQFFQTPSIEFIGRRKAAYFISGILFLIGVASLVMRGGLNLSIDFVGGTSVALKFNQDITSPQIREALNTVGMGTSEIRSFGAQNEYLIYLEQQKGASASEMTEIVKQAITATFPDITYDVLKIDVVGPRIGEELRNAAILAVLIAMALILVYIGIRFELVFSFGAIAALFHDVIITLGIFNLLNYELSLKEIAAFLTIVGYSLNDTIVVYDRVRENLKSMRNEDLSTIINRSINQCLSRTIITSVTTLIVVLILFLIGGEVMKGFAFALLIGVVIGTYSSVFVASPIVLEWQMRHGGKRQLRMSRKKR